MLKTVLFGGMLVMAAVAAFTNQGANDQAGETIESHRKPKPKPAPLPRPQCECICGGGGLPYPSGCDLQRREERDFAFACVGNKVPCKIPAKK